MAHGWNRPKAREMRALMYSGRTYTIHPNWLDPEFWDYMAWMMHDFDKRRARREKASAAGMYRYVRKTGGTNGRE